MAFERVEPQDLVPMSNADAGDKRRIFWLQLSGAIIVIAGGFTVAPIATGHSIGLFVWLAGLAAVVAVVLFFVAAVQLHRSELGHPATDNRKE